MPLSEPEEYWLAGFLDEVESHPKVSAWERSFITDQQKRYAEYGNGMFLSGKQWAVLMRVAEKIGYDSPDRGK